MSEHGRDCKSRSLPYSGHGVGVMIMKKTLIALLTLLMVGLMGFTALGSIGFCTETDGSDAYCFGDANYLYFGTGRDAKMAWVSDSVVFTGDFDLVGALDITGSLTFSGALAVTGNLTADGAVMSIDGSTSVDFISAGHVDTECADIRLGLNAADYMKFVTSITTGNLAITHSKSSLVTWTAGGGFDFVGAFAADALTLSDVLTFSGGGTIDNTAADTLTLVEDTVAVTGIFDVTGNIAANGTTIALDGATSVRGISAGFVILESPANRFGLNATEYMQITTTITSGNTAITHTGATPDVTWAADSLTFTGDFEVVGGSTFDAITGVGNLDIDATTALVDGSTSARLISATLASVEAANVRLGVSDTIYMDFAVTAVNGDTAITHTGATPDVTWAADSLTFTGAFEVAGASTFDAITSVGNLSVDAVTALIDGATSVRAVSAGFNSLEGPANRFGSDASWYMSIATTATSGNTAITHTGGTPAVTWAADSLTFTGAFEVVGASTFDAITGVGNLSIDGTTVSLDGSTSVDFLSAGHVDIECADIRLGLNATEYMRLVTTVTSGNLAIDHPGKTPNITWTATAFDFVGTMALDATTLSDVLTFSDGGTLDNTAANTLTMIEDNIVFTGDTSVTSTNTMSIGSNPVVLNHRHRITISEINLGHELLPAIAGRTYRIIDVVVVAYGGAIGATTTVDILGDQAGAVKLFTFAQANLTQSTLLTIDSAAGVVILADGASFIPCTANTAITVGKTGADCTVATGVDFIITYVIE